MAVTKSDAVPAVGRAPTQRGRRTREALMTAALNLMQGGRSFNSLSMREVAQAAGVVPSGFYRHYRGMNDLGLALVEDVGQSLRPLLRQARLEAASSKNIIRDSVVTYKRFVEDNPTYFLVASGERHGGSRYIREAIRKEISRFVEEMAQDVHQLGLVPNMSEASLRMCCELVVSTMLTAASDILDLTKSSPAVQRARIESYVQQLRVIFMGARMWREKSQRRQK